MVSVIIPTFNRANLLLRAIRSVLSQTYKDFELIVIDDASEDNTREVVNGFSDRRIKYIRLNERAGSAASRNIGIKTSRGKFLTFLDSDDEWHSKKLEYQVNDIKDQSDKIGIVYTKTIRKYKNREYYIPSCKVKHREGYLYRNLILGQYIVPTPSALVKKVCFDKCGYFDEKLQVLEEWDLWIRMSRFFKFKFINKPMTFSYYTPSSLSTHRDLFALGTCKIINKHFKDFIFRPDALLLGFVRIIRLYFGHFIYLLGWNKD